MALTGRKDGAGRGGGVVVDGRQDELPLTLETAPCACAVCIPAVESY